MGRKSRVARLEVSRQGAMPQTSALTGQQADDNGKQRYTFDEGTGDNHGGEDSASSFGLAGDGFHGRLSNLADA